MAFLHHHPRRTTRSQLSSSPSTASLSQSTQINRRGNASTHVDRDGPGEVQDWSVVFPGRIKVDAVTASPLAVSESISPFVLPSDEEVDGSNIELTLPHEQDGTGRFTRPSSPSYAADDEEDEDEVQGDMTVREGKTSTVPGTSLLDSNSEENSDLDELEVTSSIFLSGSEMERRDSNASHRPRRLSEWETGSWAWMNAEGSQQQSLVRERVRASRHQSVLPVVFTSGSEGEEDQEAYRIARQSKLKEDLAFEDALSNTHLAQSAGLAFRAPKRRHRKNGESAKGSKRSNSSAVIASDLQVSRRRRGLHSRKSATSNVSGRSNSRLRSSEKGGVDVDGQQNDSRSQGLLSVVLRKLFSVEDDEVLQAFLRDEGPLRVDDTPTSLPTLASDASSALRIASSHDEVWSRNERSRRSHYFEAEDDALDQVDDEVPKVLLQLPPRGMDSSQMLSAPHRVRLQSHVGEPTLLEALQATVFSSLNNVPSGLSILLAGSRSVRLVNYLAGRLVGQIGPSLTERMRKLIDDAEDDTSAQDEILGRETTSTVRFRGNSHPAISSHSSTTHASRGPSSS